MQKTYQKPKQRIYLFGLANLLFLLEKPHNSNYIFYDDSSRVAFDQKKSLY
jgi:hypothetical protein